MPSNTERLHINKIRLVGDSPTETLSPELTGFSKNLTSHIKHQTTQPDSLGFNCTLLSGDWGSGKTSIMKQVQKELEQDDGPIKTLMFEAWRYEAEENLLFSLLWQLFEMMNPDVSKPRKQPNAWNYTLATVGQYLGVSASKIQKDVDAIKSQQQKKERPRFLEDYISTDKFLKCLNDIIEKEFEEGKLIIFIDDLDRCSPESAMKLLDNIRHMITASSGISKNLFFLVAMDKITLKQAIQHKFSDFSAYDSNRYLEKLFPLTFQVPAFNIQLNDVLENDSDNKSARDRFDAILSQPFFNNPRLTKRCINQLTTYWQPARMTKPEFRESMIEWLAAINRWPMFRDLVNEKGDGFWERVSNQLRQGSTERDTTNIHYEDMEQLFKQPGIKRFLENSVVFGNIRHHEGSDLQTRIAEYKKVNDELMRIGI